MKNILQSRSASNRFVRNELVFRAAPAPLRTINENDRTIEMVASTEAPDRIGDIIRQAGWNLTNFNNNPVFLFSHRSDDPPIGRIVKTTIEKGVAPALVQKVQFAKKEVYPFGDTIYKMFKAGFMNATSVGFMAIKHRPMLDANDKYIGQEFLEQELYELSAVPVPANPQALARQFHGNHSRANRAAHDHILKFILTEAVQRNIIGATEALTVEKASALCGDKNPPWAYNLAGVTFDDGPGNENDPLETILGLKSSQSDPLDELLAAL